MIVVIPTEKSKAGPKNRSGLLLEAGNTVPPSQLAPSFNATVTTPYSLAPNHGKRLHGILEGFARHAPYLS
jgi:hypothetical protein